MARWFFRLILIVVLVGAGWSIGRAQTSVPQPDFELVISGAAGDTEVKCLKGCKLSYRTIRPVNPAHPVKEPLVDPKTAQEKVGFGCGNRDGCELLAAGWIQR